METEEAKTPNVHDGLTIPMPEGVQKRTLPYTSGDIAFLQGLGVEAIDDAQVSFENESQDGDIVPPYLREVAEAELLTYNVDSTANLGGGANETLIATLSDGSHAVFKPKDGEVPLRAEVSPGTYYLRERAAYVISQLLDFDVVPPTIVSKVDKQIGSLQDFLENAKAGMMTSFDLDDPEYREELSMIWLLDYFIWNTDRHAMNYMVDDTKVYAIDHGLSFAKPSYGQFSSIRSYSNCALDKQIIERLQRFANWEDGYKVMESMLKDLLPKDERKAAMSRVRTAIDIILKDGKISSFENRMGYNGVESTAQSTRLNAYGEPDA